MAERFAPDRLPQWKTDRYAALAEEIGAVLEGEPEVVARMATVASMVSAAFPEFLWTGFYQVDPRKPGELVVGPYQGTLGCLRIAFGRGVCGTAARRFPGISPAIRALAARSSFPSSTLRAR
jgi:L-methionine (R)-S-oxide reductase